MQGAASRHHEGPARRLGRLVERLCLARGSGAHCLGATDLRVRGEDGTPTDIMEADETVYLRAAARLPTGAHIIVGEDDLPDVVLEVDNTTDVRGGKLLAYEAWGFGEVWVEVPDGASPSRPQGLRPGLTIHLRESGRYVESAASRAFPGWRAEEIHRALNEAAMSEETSEVLWRVGRALGQREGTQPEDDHLLRKFGREQRAEGRAAGLAATARAILRDRGIKVPEDRLLAAVRDAAPGAVAAAALHAGDEADFLARLESATSPEEPA